MGIWHKKHEPRPCDEGCGRMYAIKVMTGGPHKYVCVDCAVKYARSITDTQRMQADAVIDSMLGKKP